MTQKNEQILTEWLVLNCQIGEPLAFEQLVKLWYPKLLRYACRLLNDNAKAEDAVQTTFEILSNSIRRLNDPASFPKWVYQILNNKCVDIIRTKQKQEKIAEELTQHQLVHSSANQTFESESAFEELLSGLSPKLYKIVHLHYLEGLTVNEIGQILKLPQGTVKSRLHNARNIINQQLAAEG